MTSKQSLFQIVNGLRYFGVGCKLARDTFSYPETYWIVTRHEYFIFCCIIELTMALRRVFLSKDQSHGKAWGRLVWRGRPKPNIQKIGPARKEGWKLVAFPDYHNFRGNADFLEAPSPVETVSKIESPPAPQAFPGNLLTWRQPQWCAFYNNATSFTPKQWNRISLLWFFAPTVDVTL
eukprot:gene7374-15061_t